MRFLKLNFSDDGGPVWVNFALVTSFARIPEDGGTLLFFGEGADPGSFSVAESPDQIEDILIGYNDEVEG